MKSIQLMQYVNRDKNRMYWFADTGHGLRRVKNAQYHRYINTAGRRDCFVTTTAGPVTRHYQTVYFK